MSKTVVAAIDVGSHALRMKVGELNKSGKFKELESYRKIVALGHDTFTKGMLTFESVDKVCDMLKVFKNSFDDYGVEQYQAMATSAIREASNRDYIVDQIKVKTGLDIQVISNSQEQFLTHKATKYSLENYEELIKEGAVIVVVGAGSIQVTTYKNGKLQSSQNVKMGALRIKEVFSNIEGKVVNYNDIIDEYITSNLEGVDMFAKDTTYEHLIAVGGEISVISKIIELSKGEIKEELTKKQFNSLFDTLNQMSVEEIEEAYRIKRERAEIIVPSMMLFKKFMEKVNSQVIITPRISLSDGIIRNIHDKLAPKKRSQELMEDIVTSAEVKGKKFNYNETHSQQVAQHANVLFDRLTRLHGLKEERILLTVAAILHDIGKIISLDRHYFHSYELIRNLEIFGLSHEDMNIVANIACYHSMVKPSQTDPNFVALPSRDRAIAAKLIAIMRLADALDRSHKGKLHIRSVSFKEKELVVQCVCNTNVDTTLEEWTFNKKSDFFMEVFGVTPILKIKREFK
jgi:exopolyphosphatase/guanosine-5'-triphosphate,3'-diphosphate pyrophosphatase